MKWFRKDELLGVATPISNSRVVVMGMALEAVLAVEATLTTVAVTVGVIITVILPLPLPPLSTIMVADGKLYLYINMSAFTDKIYF